jgi:hypothetical protein
MTLEQYINNLNQRYQLGNATEHTFRGDLQQLLESVVPDIQATNEPKRQKCGAPDYILTRKDIPVGFIEAKDIGDKDLMGDKKTGNKEQFDRYKASLPNLIFTDYMRFILYRNGECITEISIGELNNGAITPMIDNFAGKTAVLTGAGDARANLTGTNFNYAILNGLNLDGAAMTGAMLNHVQAPIPVDGEELLHRLAIGL